MILQFDYIVSLIYVYSRNSVINKMLCKILDNIYFIQYFFLFKDYPSF